MMTHLSFAQRFVSWKRVAAVMAALLALLLVAGAGPAVAQIGGDDNTIPPIPEPLPDGTDPYAEIEKALGLIDSLLERRDLTKKDKTALLKARNEVTKGKEGFGNLDIPLAARNTTVMTRLSKGAKIILRLGIANDPSARAVNLALTNAARLMAERYLDHAAAVGVDQSRIDQAERQYDLAKSKGNAHAYDKAIIEFGKVFKTLAPDLVFDMNLFEQAIIDRFEDDVVGMAYVITNNGKIAREGAMGNARLHGEPGNTGVHIFTVNTELMVASVSKTVTAVGVMRMLQEHGLSPDDSVAPFFPSYWDVPSSINNLTFRDLLTHNSGLNGFTGAAGTTRCGNDYFALKTCIERGIVTGDKVFAYQNSNFGIFRLILPYMEYEAELEAAIAPADCNQSPVQEAICDSTLANFMGEEFESLMRCKVFDKMKLGDPGVAGCDDGPSMKPEDLPQTLMYSAPGAVENGFATADHTLDGGGFGWYFTARELAQFQAYRRYSTAVLSKASRSIMDNGYLGWMQPGEYGALTSGLFGTYRMHGGDWNQSGGRRINTCIIDFPLKIQVSLVINSDIGDGSYQCNALKLAYDAAWVAK